MSEKTKLVITNDTEFYGFLNGMDIIDAGKVAEILRSQAMCAIYENDTRQNVVDEIISREGVFYTGLEAKYLAPWVITNTQLYFAKFKFNENEPRPTNPAYGDYNWVILDGIQFQYAKYIESKIQNNELKFATN